MPMKKKLNVDLIQSELRGGSAFFPGYKGGDSPTTSSLEPKKITTADDSSKPHIPETETANKVGVPPSAPRPVRGTVLLIPKVKRPIKQRQPFDIYEDQYKTLKDIADAEKDFVNGRGMSQMVRDAIDQYLKNNASIRK